MNRASMDSSESFVMAAIVLFSTGHWIGAIACLVMVFSTS